METCEREGAFLDIAERTHELLKLSIQELERALVAVPAIADEATGDAFAFTSVTHLSKWIEANAPSSPDTASVFEQVVFDEVDEAA